MTLDEAWRILAANQFKRTKNRETILTYFSKHDKYISAMEVRNFMAQDNPGISYDTIYRNLATFSELGILEETELGGELHFRMQCEAGVHHHHLICTSCGTSRSIPYCPMSTVSGDFGGFEVEGHKFEIYGKCPSCRKN